MRQSSLLAALCICSLRWLRFGEVVLGGDIICRADLWREANFPSMNMLMRCLTRVSCFLGSVGAAGARRVPSKVRKSFQKAVGVVRYCSVCGEFACMCVQCEDISVSTILYNIFCNCRLNLMGVLE